MLETAYKKHKFDFKAQKLANCEPSLESAVVAEHDIEKKPTQYGATGCKAIVEYREYSEVERMWRVRTQADRGMTTVPPENKGARISDELSVPGARKIAESSEYVAAAYGGFSTFCTGTFNAASRKKIRSFKAKPLSIGDLYSPEVHPINCRRVNPEWNGDQESEKNRGFSSVCFHGDDNSVYTPIEFTPETTIQRETSRTLDAMNKIYQRGCLLDIAQPSADDEIISIHPGRYSVPAGFKLRINKYKSIVVDGACSTILYRVKMDRTAVPVEIKRGKELAFAGDEVCEGLNADAVCWPIKFKYENLRYAWVVEVPKNSMGEDNPHIHLMMDWQVPYRFFEAWAERLESLWGGGYFHLEKIKDTKCAGAYMAKAAGYMGKGVDGDQGTVTGNRYGISANARAPAWVVVSEDQMHCMGQLINDVYEYYQEKNKDDLLQRKKLNKALEKMPKKNKKNKTAREKIARKLQGVRRRLNAIPIAPSRYQVVLKNKEAALEFFSWVRTPTMPNVYRPEYFPEKPEGVYYDSGERVTPSQYSVFLTRIRKKISHSRFMRKLQPPAWIAETFTNDYWHQVKDDLFAPSLACCPQAPPVVSELYQ